MADTNANDPVRSVSLWKHFGHFPWQTQVAVVTGVIVLVAQGFITVPRVFRADPAVAQVASTLAQVATTSAEISATTKETNGVVKELNANISELTTLMTLYVCETESDSQWMVSLGQRGVQFCNSVRDKAVDIIIQDVYRR